MNQKRVLVSLKRKISLDLWDPNRKKARRNSGEARLINQTIDQTQSRLFQCYQELSSQGKKVTANLVQALYLREDENSKTLQNIIQYHSRKIESTLAYGSIRNFGITEGYLNKFLKKEKNSSDVYLKELNYKFLCDFENFLLEYYPKKHPRAMSHNKVMKHIQRLSKKVRMAYHLEWIEKDPFMRWKTTNSWGILKLPLHKSMQEFWRKR